MDFLSAYNVLGVVLAVAGFSLLLFWLGVFGHYLLFDELPFDH